MSESGYLLALVDGIAMAWRAWHEQARRKMVIDMMRFSAHQAGDHHVLEQIRRDLAEIESY